MRFPKFVGLLMVSFLLAAGLQASDYTLDNFKNQLEDLDQDDAIISLCRDYMLNVDDIDFIRAVQNTWMEVDPDGVRAYSKQQMEQNPDSPKYLYLYGRTVDSDVQKVKIGRKAIELDPQWSYGYRLALATYVNALFDKNSNQDQIDSLTSMLPKDAPLFEKLVEVDSGAGYALQFLFNYQIYEKDFSGALNTLEKGKSSEAGWANNENTALVYAGLGRFDEARKLVDDEITAMLQQGLPADQETKYREMMYFSTLNAAGAYQEAVNYIKSIPGYNTSKDKLYDLACAYSKLGETDMAFQSLKQAIGNGWDLVDHTRDDADLESLHSDPRWEGIMAGVQLNWDNGAPERKAEALAGKVEKDAPEWTLPDADGNMVSLASLRGKILVLDFWATWCGPCRLAMPMVDEFTKNYATDDILVFSVNVWERGKSKPLRFLKNNEYAMKLLYGNNDLAKAYGVTGIPYLCVIDKNGKIRFEETGYSPNLLEKLVWWTSDLE